MWYLFAYEPREFHPPGAGVRGASIGPAETDGGRLREGRLPGRQGRDPLASAGDAAGFDTTSLASLAAGNIAATGGLANLIGEKEFSILFHEGERDNMHLSVVAERLILVVVFDRRSSVGLVRLRVRQATTRFAAVMATALAASEEELEVVEELTEADIESLFK